MEILILFILIIIWATTLSFAFVGGFLFAKAKRRATKQNPTQIKSAVDIRRAQKEYENFLTYDGTPQDKIDD